MNRYTWGSIILSALAAASGVVIAANTVAAWPQSGPQATQLAFMAGPLLYLAVLAWRRRNYAARSRFLFWLTIILVCGGLGFLGIGYVQFRHAQPNQVTWRAHPLIVPVVQWVVVVVTWLVLVIQEGREKQAAKKIA